LKKNTVIILTVSAAAVAALFLLFRFVACPVRGKDLPGGMAPSKGRPASNIAEQDAAIKRAEAVLEKDQDSPKAEAAYRSIASAYAARGNFVKARDYYRKMLEKFPASSDMPGIQEAIEGLNVDMLLSPEPDGDSFSYVVKKGDNLVRISKRYGTTVELLTRSNGLKDSRIRAGMKLKVTKLKFSIAVDKSQNILTLKADGKVFKTYRVATGKNSSTPTGAFTITNKIVDPPWYPPNGKMIPSGDPKNVLGSRWMGISKPTFGIHGTIDPQSIGNSVTEGCVRMLNAEVEELYDIVPQGTEVVIVD